MFITPLPAQLEQLFGRAFAIKVAQGGDYPPVALAQVLVANLERGKVDDNSVPAPTQVDVGLEASEVAVRTCTYRPHVAVDIVVVHKGTIWIARAGVEYLIRRICGFVILKEPESLGPQRA